MTPTTTEADTVYQVGPYSVRRAANHYETCKDIDGKTVCTISYHPATPEHLDHAIKDANTRNVTSRPLDAEKIRTAVDRGFLVYWIHADNRIVKDPITGEYVITSPGGTAMRLTSRRGPHDLNVHESDIFIHA